MVLDSVREAERRVAGSHFMVGVRPCCAALCCVRARTIAHCTAKAAMRCQGCPT